MKCPLPGKCPFDDFEKAGVHFCVTPVCPYARKDAGDEEAPRKRKRFRPDRNRRQ